MRQSEISRMFQFVLALVLTNFIPSEGKCENGMEWNGLRIEPEGDVVVSYGENLELICRGSCEVSSEDLRFEKDGIVQSSTIVNNTTIKLFVEKPEEELAFYKCRNIKTGVKLTSRVSVGSAPKNVTNFKCISRDLNELECSFETHDSLITNYTIHTEIHTLRSIPTICKGKTGTNLRSCKWDTYSNPLYRQQLETFHFVLKATNVIGDNEEHFTVDHFSIVKPAPPLDLRVVSTTDHNVTLTWRLSRNIFDFLTVGVDHKIEYRVYNNELPTRFKEYRPIGFPVNNLTYTCTITDLPSASRVRVKVAIKPVTASSDYWSEYSTAYFYTNVD